MENPLSIQEAIDKARLMREQPELMLSAEGTRALVGGLLAAIESNKCFAKAVYEGMPVFPLIGCDKHAPTLVWLWATLRELDQEDRDVVADARRICVSMMEYAHSIGRKVVGIGQAVLAGNLEMIRTINGLLREIPARNAKASNTTTSLDELRRFLSASKFESVEDEPARTPK